MKNALWLFFLTVIILVLFLPAFGRMNEVRDKNREYERQISELTLKNNELKKELRLLREDPVYLEKVARAKMGLIKEGEVIYKITPMEDEKVVGP